MRIEWVNHASYVLEHGNVRLICDPWISGNAFNQGWSLLSASAFGVEDFNRITHIWFSHEHPDHFCPQLLKAIPAEIRSRIQVLYQKTRDRKILRFCEELGFQARELSPSQWIELGPEFRIKCGAVPFFDSWLLVEANGKKILNLNDCVISNQTVAEAVRGETGPVDVLLSQFSYANWLGNPEEREKRRVAAREKFERLRLQDEVFRPRWLIPFASFVYFSHEENFYLNEEANRISDAVRFLRENTRATPVILYPGDFWEIGMHHDSASAIERYADDWQKAQERPRGRSVSVPFDKLCELSKDYVHRIRGRNNRLLLALTSRVGFFKPLSIELTDLKRRAIFDFKQGLRDVPQDRSLGAPMLELHSDSLAFLLRFEWGFDTLQVNGRFRSPGADYFSVVQTFSVATLNNTGRSFGFSLLLDASFMRRAFTKLSRSASSKSHRGPKGARKEAVSGL